VPLAIPSPLHLRRYLKKLYFEMDDLQYRIGKPNIAVPTGLACCARELAVSFDVPIAATPRAAGIPRSRSA
jgi:enoyl-CoA hydratase